MNDASVFVVATTLTSLSLIFYALLGIRTLMLRKKRHDGMGKDRLMLDRRHRLQMHTLRHLLFFLVSVWLFAWVFPHPHVLGPLGAVWLMGRVLYSAEHFIVARPDLMQGLRTTGAALSLVAGIVLVVGAAYGALQPHAQGRLPVIQTMSQ